MDWGQSKISSKLQTISALLLHKAVQLHSIILAFVTKTVKEYHVMWTKPSACTVWRRSREMKMPKKPFSGWGGEEAFLPPPKQKTVRPIPVENREKPGCFFHLYGESNAGFTYG